ncbi:MAG TPA: YeeE/YedE family protein [Gammaproteobacteria bacterium]|nr:YeeE/YedE family protein [Gammaproteobacteria bacterium]
MTFDSFASAHAFLLGSTLVASIILGAVVNKTNFCTMGAISDAVNIGDLGRFRAWLLAIAIATLGVTVLEFSGVISVSSAFPPYRNGQLIIGENLLGGLLFGIGMTLASGCGNKTLVRIGGGNLKSIVVFAIIALVAWYMINPLPGSDQTLFSLLFYHWIRAASIPLSGEQDIGALLGGDNKRYFRLGAGLLVSALLFIYVFRSRAFRRSFDNILGGVVIGLIVLSGWYVTSGIQINADDSLYTLASYYEEWDMLSDSEAGKPALGRSVSPQSYTFINPIGQTYGYLKEGLRSNLVSFGLVAVLGVVLGSLLWSLMSRSFRLEWFASWRDFITHAIGAMLMGVGGVLALGCTIGQGISGFSTLALGSILTLGAIILGSALTMKVQYYKLVYEEEASFLKALLSSLADLKLAPAALRRLDPI